MKGTGAPWRLMVRHQTCYRYEQPVAESYNEARMAAESEAGQFVLRSDLTVAPNATLLRYRDYWGTSVTAFDLHAAHDELQVTSTCLVEVDHDARSRGELCTWADLASDPVRDRRVEFLAATPRTAPDDRVRAAAAELASAATPEDAARGVADWVHRQLAYVPGSTGVHTSAVEALDAGEGVCQDFAHLTLALLREARIPCRYVSGYLHPQPDAAVGETVPGESHAWVEWWTGEWRMFDPTNNARPTTAHVVVGRGRDYADVAPLTGIVRGGATSNLWVQVQVTRLR